MQAYTIGINKYEAFIHVPRLRYQNTNGYRFDRLCKFVCFSEFSLLTFPRLNGRLFCVQRISVSGMEPSTSQLMLYSISDAKCFGFDVMLIEVGFTISE